MTTLYECAERSCFNVAHHFHSNQCYSGCVECYPTKDKKPLKGGDAVDKVLLGLGTFFVLVGLFCFAMSVITIVTGNDGTYQQCLLPTEERQSFKCNNISRDEFYRDYKLDGSIAPDGREYWYVSFE